MKSFGLMMTVGFYYGALCGLIGWLFYINHPIAGAWCVVALIFSNVENKAVEALSLLKDRTHPQISSAPKDVSESVAPTPPRTR